jgi:hypothetical protein
MQIKTKLVTTGFYDWKKHSHTTSLIAFITLPFPFQSYKSLLGDWLHSYVILLEQSKFNIHFETNKKHNNNVIKTRFIRGLETRARTNKLEL